MAFSGRSRKFLKSLKFGSSYDKAQRRYINSLRDSLEEQFQNQQDSIEANRIHAEASSIFQYILGGAQTVGGVVGAFFTGGATLPIAADGIRRLSTAGDQAESFDLQFEDSKRLEKSYRQQLDALDVAFESQQEGYEHALFNVGKELRLLEIKLDQSQFKLEDQLATGLRRIGEKRLGFNQKLDLLRNNMSNFQIQNNLAIRKANDEFTTHFKSFVDRKAVLSGYQQAAMDSAEAADFFTGLDVNIATQKGVTALGAQVGGESEESSSNRRLNQASKVFTELNIAQDKAFQQRFKTNQALLNSLLNIRGSELKAESTLTLQAIGLRGAVASREQALLGKIQETEIQENYFNNLLGVLEQDQAALHRRFGEGISTLEQTYAVAVDSANRSVEGIKRKAILGLKHGFNQFGSKVSTLGQTGPSINLVGQSFGDLLGQVNSTVNLINDSKIGGSDFPTLQNLPQAPIDYQFPQTQNQLFQPQYQYPGAF